MKVVICEQCYNIPKITILNNSKIRIECLNCNESKIEECNYFDKFKENINDELFELNNCNYENHEEDARAKLYCFQCDKYICESCLNNIHNRNQQTKRHSTIIQKIRTEYYCRKLGHEEYILDRYCPKCNSYLCSRCNCEHSGSDIFTFENQENKIREIKKNIEKCKEIINIEENYLKKYIKKIQDKIDILNNQFKDYKNRNLNAISIYELLIDNYEKTCKAIKNYNIYNNININDNFNLNESKIFSNECLLSTYNRLSTFYMNTNHNKTKEYTNYYITEKHCDKKIKKCIIINNNVIAYIYEKKLDNVSFAYKLKEDSPYSNYDIFYENFIKDIHPLNNDKFIILDYLNKLKIFKINIIDNNFGNKTITSFININYYLKDLYDNNNFFMIQHDESFFNLKYCSGEKYDKCYLISKENKKFIIKNIFEDINKIIDNSNINNNDKSSLKSIFIYNGHNDENLEKLINVNNQFLLFFENKNKELYNRMRNKINQNELNYLYNSNYIFKTFKRLNNNINNNNLNQNERNDITYMANFNNICGDIIEKYINYYIFNSKINNIYNYLNKFLFFMGENYLINAYSLKDKRFYTLAPINFFIDRNNFNDFGIIQITSEEVVLNDSKNKFIYFIENNQNYNFILLSKTFNYHSNIAIDNNYLLFDKIENNELQFSFIDLSNFSNTENKELIELLNFKINYNIPKIIFNEGFKKFITLYDNNQLCILDYIYEKEFKNQDNIQINKINLKLDNKSEIIPPQSEFSSVYNNDYKVENLFLEKDYYCSKTNKNESILFDFEKEYYFKSINISYIDKYKKGRLKKFNLIILDKEKRLINKIDYSVDKLECNNLNVPADNKGRYLKFEFLENFGEEYFVIGKMKFLVEQTYSINDNI